VIWFLVAVAAPIIVLFLIAKFDCGEDIWGDP
jgi:hypothetical protein